ncbi:hypothetical protein [Thalassoglobus polymorphus]|uniref:DUF3592 domain-containing protein n=1 Tax=Thalassoglobus polymorphus TaxID=2527994 RepID=A0A517QTY7_9PLAN|nr:hypothetical protein [Thalassoglobus polymorphus]QDT35072.1 hypothetical protein Mal48_43470 [Thalassoglobus polymorphus]
MDDEEELKSFKRILFATVLFLISTYFAFKEVKYIIFGKTATATVQRVFETEERGRRGRKRKLLAIEYSFMDESGRSHSERDDVAVSWGDPGKSVEVEYLSGVEDSSRLHGHSNKTSIWIFLGCLSWLTYTGYKLAKEANEPFKPQRR